MTPESIKAARRWIECDRAVAIDNAAKIDTELPMAREQHYETILACLSVMERIVEIDGKILCEAIRADDLFRESGLEETDYLWNFVREYGYDPQDHIKMSARLILDIIKCPRCQHTA